MKASCTCLCNACNYFLKLLQLNGHGFDEDDWLDDTSAEAVKSRMKDLTDHAASMTMNDDLEKPEKERVDMFYNFVKKIVKSNNIKQVNFELII